MKSSMRRFSRIILPLTVFVVVGGIHFLWLGLFPERDPVQDRWVAVPEAADISWTRRYVETGSFWLGFSYALSLGFAAVALRRYREHRSRRTKNLAIGGATFSGVLVVAGCYLLGCCGSPMLIVYLNLFGAGFLPLAKPLVAGLTTVMVLVGWYWMNRANPSAVRTATATTMGIRCECTSQSDAARQR